MNTQEEVLYLDPLELSGPEQMAIDLFLLEKSFTDKDFFMQYVFTHGMEIGYRLAKIKKNSPENGLNFYKMNS